MSWGDAVEMVMGQMKASAIAECEGYTAIDRERLRKSAEEKNAKTVWMKGFVVEIPGDGCGPMRLMREHWTPDKLYHSAGTMTVFQTKAFAEKALKQSRSRRSDKQWFQRGRKVVPILEECWEFPGMECYSKHHAELIEEVRDNELFGPKGRMVFNEKVDAE